MDYYKIREQAYPYNYAESIAAIFFSILGFILGSLSLYILLKNKWKSLSVDLKLICFTLVFDMIFGSIGFICGICNLVGFAGYLSSKPICAINAITIVFSTVSSINIVGVVALERYFLIVKEKLYYKRTYLNIILSLQLINLVGCVISGVFGSFYISSTSVSCLYDTTKWGGICGTIVILLSISTSISVTYFSYINIIIKRRKLALQNQRILPFKAKKLRRDANSTIIKSVLIIIASTITNIPYIIFLLIELIDPKFLTPLIQTICTVSAMSNMMINALIILHLRSDIWNKFKEAIFIKSENSSENDVSIDDYQLTMIETDESDK